MMLTHRWGMQVAMKKPVAEFMTRKVIAVSRRDKYSVVKKLMTEHEISHIPVAECDEVLGIISIKDILRFAYSREMDVDEIIENADLDARVSAERMMTSPVITIQETSPIQLAAEFMIKYGIHSLPVVRHEKLLVGIITSSDILKIVLANI